LSKLFGVKFVSISDKPKKRKFVNCVKAIDITKSKVILELAHQIKIKRNIEKLK